MATPMKHGASQQGKTPSQSQHAAGASPPVSTPFSASHAAFSPHGPRSSPQTLKKSPAASTLLGQPGSVNSATVNFDSPSAAAAFGVLGMGGLDLNLDNVGGLGGLPNMGRIDDEERARRLQQVIDILSESKGLVCEEGLERLVKNMGMECLWEDDMGGGDSKPRTFIVAGSALELLIVMANHMVQSVSLAFPESAEIVAKHAEKAGRVLFDDLKLAPGQLTITKKLDDFAANFERLAALDKLSVIPGLNLFEAIGGIYESLERLYQWDLQKVREDPALNGKNDEYLDNMVLCTRNGRPVMHARGHVGLSIQYWKEKRLITSRNPRELAYIEQAERIWGIIIGCALLNELPFKAMAIPPVRVSDKWISPEIEKVSGPDDLQPGPVIDWLEPDQTLIHPPGSGNGESSSAGLLLGPKFPEAIFIAVLDPPLHVPLNVWEEVRQRGGALPSNQFMMHPTLDSLMFPYPPGSQPDASEPRNITRTRSVEVVLPGQADISFKKHRNRFWVYRSVYGKTLTEIPFSHPQELASMLPLLRQYAFLSTLMENSFNKNADASEDRGPESHGLRTTSTTTKEEECDAFTAEAKAQRNSSKRADPAILDVDVNFIAYPVPRLNVTFPWRQNKVANVTLEIQANGHVHVEAQNVLDESNSTSATGAPRRPEDLGKILETIEDIGKWVEFLRTRWS